MSEPDLLVALVPVLETLGRLGVRHCVSGSLASSAHGVPRASIDADVVAALLPLHSAPLVAAWRDLYYVPEQRLEEAIARRSSFNVIHLATMVKIDVFVSRDRPFDRRMLDRVRLASVEAAGTLPIASAEDVLLAKLEWYRLGGEVSERQWGDVIGLLRVGEALDVGYLRAGARELDVSDLLQRALGDVEDRPGH